MQNLRTLGWVFLTALVVAFVVMNWTDPQEVRFWPGMDGSGLLFEWPVGFIALVFFLVGFVPMWLLYRAHKWSTARRIASLENAVRTAAAAPVTVAPPPPPPAEAPSPLQSDPAPADAPAAEASDKEPGSPS